MRSATRLCLAALLATSAATGVLAQDVLPDGDWRTINRDLAATRYSPLADINTGNVSRLQQAWTYQLRGFNTAVPLVVNGVMYLPAPSRVVALNAATGEEIWVHDGPGGQGNNYASRGVGYWPGEGDMGPRILVMQGSDLIALDASTGQLVPTFGNGGVVELEIGFGGAPSIGGHVAIIGASSLENPQGNPGNPRAFDVRTGEKLWEFDTTPAPGEIGGDTWGDGWKDRGGTNMWGPSATIDAENGVAFLPIAGPAHNYYGGDRPGANLFGNSIVAVDLETGEYKWHFQTVHHDIWDIDMSYAGNLIPVRGPDGRRHMALTNVGKSSLFYVLDAKDGTPVQPVEERPVPRGDVPGEYYAPTQPFPVNTPPLSRTTLYYDDIVTPEDTNPAHSQACHDMWDKAGGYVTQGLFTPFIFHKEGDTPLTSIAFPGGTGGVNWGGPTADPTTGIVYANVQDGSLVGWIERVKGDKPYSFDAATSGAQIPYDRASVDGKGPFFTFSAPLSGEYDENGRGVGVSAPCYKPPWSRLTAVDANTGKILWAVPLGIYEDQPEGKQLLGNSGSAGPSVTAGGLVFVGATNDKRFRAFDARTGQQLWEATLTGNANANPMTYRASDGKQYVAINASGAIMVYSLGN